MTFTIRRIIGDDWQEFRESRLRMLADTPIAYGETLEQARQRGDAEWVQQAARNEQGSNIGFVAIDDEGRWLGVMRGYVSPNSGPMLVGVFVDPDARGRHAGISDALLDSVIDWARVHGTTLTLDVHADNARAIAFYERRGFTNTGITMPYELHDGGTENEMRLQLV